MYNSLLSILGLESGRLQGIIYFPLFISISYLQGQSLSVNQGWDWVAGKLDAVLGGLIQSMIIRMCIGVYILKNN